MEMKRFIQPMSCYEWACWLVRFCHSVHKSFKIYNLYTILKYGSGKTKPKPRQIFKKYIEVKGEKGALTFSWTPQGLRREPNHNVFARQNQRKLKKSIGVPLRSSERQGHFRHIAILFVYRNMESLIERS